MNSEAVFIGVFILVASLIYFTPFVWVLASNRSRGGAKFGWFILTFFFSWLGLAAFLIVTQPVGDGRI